MRTNRFNLTIPADHHNTSNNARITGTDGMTAAQAAVGMTAACASTGVVWAARDTIRRIAGDGLVGDLAVAATATGTATVVRAAADWMGWGAAAPAPAQTFNERPLPPHNTVNGNGEANGEANGNGNGGDNAPA